MYKRESGCFHVKQLVVKIIKHIYTKDMDVWKCRYYNRSCTFCNPSTNNYECTVKYSPTLTRIKRHLELCHDFSSYQMKMKSKQQIAPFKKRVMAAICYA